MQNIRKLFCLFKKHHPLLSTTGVNLFVYLDIEPKLQWVFPGQKQGKNLEKILFPIEKILKMEKICRWVKNYEKNKKKLMTKIQYRSTPEYNVNL